MAADKIDPSGLAISFPAACGYEPWIGSKSAGPLPTEAEGSNPSEPLITLASSLIGYRQTYSPSVSHQTVLDSE